LQLKSVQREEKFVSSLPPRINQNSIETEKDNDLLMRRKLFKLSVFALFCAVFAVYGLNGAPAAAFTSGPVASRTGAPGELNCTACHGGSAVNSGGGTLAITGLPQTYTPNQEVTVTVTLTQTGRSKFGFQLTAIDDQGRRAGDLILTETNRTNLATGPVGANLRQYINHTGDGTSSTAPGQGSWSFRWKAPAQSVGRVTFYAAGNAANGNGSSGGDLIYTTNTPVQAGTTLASFTSVSAASFSQTASITADSILAGFGTGLSQNVVSASTTPLPTTLDGTEVKVRDSANTERSAGLFFVAPTQINYLVPTGTANGAATVTVLRNGTAASQGTVNVVAVSPSLFSAAANGQGLAAAVVLRRRNNVDTFEPVVQIVGGQPQAIPIDLGPEGDLVVLLTFGTGFRAAAQSAVSATVGGTASTFVSTAPVMGLAGLDQANILLSRSLAGRGLVDVVFTAGGINANTVQVNIK
jgi:uncharacterized protein (TIGR03437 family)